jgi:hypothetical protein
MGELPMPAAEHRIMSDVLGARPIQPVLVDIPIEDRVKSDSLQRSLLHTNPASSHYDGSVA